MRGLSLWVRSFLVVTLAGPFAAACTTTPDCRPGANRCVCTPANVCDPGLTCLEGLCVVPDGSLDAAGAPETGAPCTSDAGPQSVDLGTRDGAGDTAGDGGTTAADGAEAAGDRQGT